VKLSVAQGETLRRRIVLPRAVTAADMQVRVTREDPGDPVVDLDETDGLAINEAGDEITLVVAASVTAALAARDYVYDLFVTYADTGDRRRLFPGQFIVVQAVTR